jgi:peptidoglycan/xylan/chitin deacetylase (PgdA/CDA1 family)
MVRAIKAGELGLSKDFFEAVLRKTSVLRLITHLEGFDSRMPNQVRVLTYHLIEDGAAFEKQMDFLARNFYIASMPELISACQGHSTLPPKSVLITFDDAYRNFDECAWPILKRYSFSVSIFVPTAFPGNQERIFWWDKLEYGFSQTFMRDPLQTPIGRLPLGTDRQRTHAFKRLRKYVKTLPHHQALAFVDQICVGLNCVYFPRKVLNWDDLRRLAKEGVTIGAHTQTHPLMNRISIQAARDEVIGSMKDLQREIGIADPVFAYPDGRYTKEVVQAVKDAGFYLAFTTLRGTNDLDHADHFRMRRNNIGRRATQPILRARLLQASINLDWS